MAGRLPDDKGFFLTSHEQGVNSLVWMENLFAIGNHFRPELRILDEGHCLGFAPSKFWLFPRGQPTMWN